MKTKLHLIIMCLVLLFMVGGPSVCLAADIWSYPTSKPSIPFGGGTGRQSDPYLIKCAQDLANLAYMVNHGTKYEGKYFKLTTNIVLNDLMINLSGNIVYGSPTSWTPIGGSKCFKGTFNGGGHTIKGLYIKEEDSEYNGLFGSVENATISNLKIDNSCIYSTGNGFANFYGFLCGKSYGSVKCRNVHVTKSLLDIRSIQSTTGGLIGETFIIDSYVIMDNCSFDGNICVTVQSTAAGMIATCKGKITNCTTSGNIYINDKDGENVPGLDWVGGLAVNVGYIEYGTVNVEHCVNYMDIHLLYSTWSGVNDNYVGTYGLCKADIVKNCANFGNLYVGADNDGNVRRIKRLDFRGIQGNYVEDCANYGNLISKGKVEIKEYPDNDQPNIRVRGVWATDSANRCVNIQKDIVLPTVNNYYMFNLCGIGVNNLYNDATISDCHSYAVNNSEASFNNTSMAENHSSLSDFTAQPFFNKSNWGVVSVADDSPYSAYNGMPVPASCDGRIIIIEGEGTAQKPYIIDSEDDLRALQEIVNNGNEVSGKYFRLDADIFGGNISSIGNSSEKPFKGHFDGNGHAITGLSSCLFGYMYGTVKNLTLLNCDVKCQSVGGALALYVGDIDGNMNGEISNCYVSGIVNVDRRWDDGVNTIGGLCNWVSDGSKVHDCYFKGTLHLSNISSVGTYVAAGIAASNRSKNGIYNCYTSFDVRQSGSFIGGDNVYGITSSGGINNCFAIVSSARDYSGCTLLNAEAELRASALGDQWIQGLYRPMLKGTKYYEVTTPEGDITYLDGIPAEAAAEGGETAKAKSRANTSGTGEDADALKSNYITSYVPKSEEELHDATLWSLPNVAIYSAEEKMDVIPNFYLDNREDLRYTPTPGAIKAMGAMYYPLQQNSTGWHMLCLPGFVTKYLFPEGSRLFIVDGVDHNAMTVQVSEVDTISSATPFIAYIPVEAEDVNLVSFGDLVFNPRTPSATSPLMGTFANTTQSDCATELSYDGKTLPHSLVSAIKPFQAWLPGVKGDMEISSTPTGIKLIGRDSDGNERIYDLRGMEMKTAKGIYIKGGKLRVKK